MTTETEKRKETMAKDAYCANRLNIETGQWEYAPRHITLERGRLISQDCAGCGQSVDIGRKLCTSCQMKAKQSA